MCLTPRSTTPRDGGGGGGALLAPLSTPTRPRPLDHTHSTTPTLPCPLYHAHCSPRRYHGTWRGCIDATPLRSLAQLRAAVAAGAPSDGFAFGLEHYEELQEPVPEATALEMLCLVKRVVREQQRCPNCDGRADEQPTGTLPSLIPPELASRCACCWHVDFVGGARRRGRAGHDADLLVWHKQVRVRVRVSLGLGLVGGLV